MRAVKHDRCNLNLTLPGGTEKNDLPAERVRVVDEVLGDSWAIETTWIADETERESVAAGSPVVLRVMGNGHPAVAMFVPEVAPDRAAIDRDHASRAIGRLYSELAEGSGDVSKMEPTAFLGLWEQAVAETTQGAGEIDHLIATLRAESGQSAEESREAILDRVRQRFLREHDGDKIGAGAAYARSIRAAVGRKHALAAAADVFDLDLVEADVMRTLVRDQPDDAGPGEAPTPPADVAGGPDSRIDHQQQAERAADASQLEQTTEPAEPPPCPSCGADAGEPCAEGCEANR